MDSSTRPTYLALLLCGATVVFGIVWLGVLIAKRQFRLRHLFIFTTYWAAVLALTGSVYRLWWFVR